MKNSNILKTLTLCLLFWLSFVMVSLLSANYSFDDASATPLSRNLQELSVTDELAKPGPAAEPAMDIAAPLAPLTVQDAVQTDHPADLQTEISGVLNKGESFAQLMKRLQVPKTVRPVILRHFSDTLDFRVLQPGDKLTVSLDHKTEMVRAIYESGQLNIHFVEKNGDGYRAGRQAIELECRTVRLAGVIDSSLFAAFSELNEEPRLIHAFADIFASKIDFNTETQKGDRFELLVEKFYKDDIFVGYGRILVGRYENEKTAFNGYYYTSDKIPSGYFDDNGEALGTWFIRSPIPFGRVTSRFSLRRKHPIDGKIRPHLGIDLAAPRGTPIMATADGTVEYIGRKGGFGKTVILKHYGSYKTYYGHLSKYGKGLKKGSRVNQKDIIGYVGSTGISTGPHLDYRIKHHSTFKNPFGIKFKAKTALADEELSRFMKSRNEIADLFNFRSGDKVLQVRQMTLTDDNRIYFL
ncbi:MAG: M23 family metallopeptidase [Proteobacteria bacterium]|nr:M23 family metallopeptidase [Pseudomonadota bacterium]